MSYTNRKFDTSDDPNRTDSIVCIVMISILLFMAGMLVLFGWLIHYALEIYKI